MEVTFTQSPVTGLFGIIPKQTIKTQANKQTKTFKNALRCLIVLLQTTAVFYSLIHAVVTKV